MELPFIEGDQRTTAEAHCLLFILLVGECEINSSVLDMLSWSIRYSSGEIKLAVYVRKLGESLR